jgi:hypothetical protein
LPRVSARNSAHLMRPADTRGGYGSPSGLNPRRADGFLSPRPPARKASTPAVVRDLGGQDKRGRPAPDGLVPARRTLPPATRSSCRSRPLPQGAGARAPPTPTRRRTPPGRTRPTARQSPDLALPSAPTARQRPDGATGQRDQSNHPMPRTSRKIAWPACTAWTTPLRAHNRLCARQRPGKRGPHSVEPSIADKRRCRPAGGARSWAKIGVVARRRRMSLVARGR